MEKEFVTYEIALALKELGFDEECFNVYDELGFIQDEKEMDKLNLIKLNAPLWQQAQSFLDDNEVIIGIIFADNVFKYTLNTDNYVSNEFKDRISAIKSATEHATNYLWNKKFKK